MSAAPDIFLSYNREDAAVAKLYADAFSAAGLEVWWDATLRSGEDYDEVTEAALREAKAVVVLWSPRSVASRWVRAEATIADRNKTLMPVTIEPCNRPVMFELKQTAELSHWRGEADDKAWQVFLSDVRRLVGVEGKAMRPTAAAEIKKAARGHRPSVAVLPFINRSGLAEDDIFADCMVEDLSAALALGKRFKVVAASTAQAYPNAARDLRTIGRELDVRLVLDCNIRRIGEAMRLTVQLVETDSGNIVWTRKFDRPLAELMALQEGLASELAARLLVEIERIEMEQALGNSGEVTAREAIIRGDALIMGRTSLARAEAAVAEARRAVALAPDYAAAHAALAGNLSVLYDLLGRDDPAFEREILDCVARSRALDPGSPLVLCRLAGALNSVGRHHDALALLRRAIAINPNLEVVRHTHGNTLMHLGRWDEAMVELDTMAGIAPEGMWEDAKWLSRAIIHFHEQRFDEALANIRRMRRNADLLLSRLVEILSLARLDRREEARAAMRSLRDSIPETTIDLVEKIVRNDFSYGPNPVRLENNVATVRELWAATEPNA